jgi:hypothetical protein
MKQYVQAALEADRQVATTLAELIIGGWLASTEITHEVSGGNKGETAKGQASLANPLASYMPEALSLFEKGPLTLVAGGGFEPPTSGS